MRHGYLVVWVALACAARAAVAQENADVLAKQLANPVAALISVLLQYNVDFNLGPGDGTKRFAVTTLYLGKQQS